MFGTPKSSRIVLVLYQEWRSVRISLFETPLSLISSMTIQVAFLNYIQNLKLLKYLGNCFIFFDFGCYITSKLDQYRSRADVEGCTLLRKGKLFPKQRKMNSFKFHLFVVFIEKLYQFKVPLISDLQCNNLIFIFHIGRSKKKKLPFPFMMSDETLLVWKLLYFSLNLRMKSPVYCCYTAKQAIPF